MFSYRIFYLASFLFVTSVIKLSITTIENNLDAPCGFLSWENETNTTEADIIINVSILENEIENNNFRRLRTSLGKATEFVIQPAEYSVLNICGYLTDSNDGYTKFPCKCESYYTTKNLSNPYWFNFYTMTSMSCAREKSPAEDCQSTTCEDISVENQCAILYQEVNCQSCYFNGVHLQSGEVYETLYSSNIQSVAVRRNCQVKRTLNGFASADPSKRESFYNGTKYHNTLRPLRYENLEVGPTFTCTCSDDEHITTSTDVTMTSTNDPTSSTIETTTEYGNTTTEEYRDTTTEEYRDTTTEEYGDTTTEEYGNTTTEEYGNTTTGSSAETTTEKVAEHYLNVLGIVIIITVSIVAVIFVLTCVTRKVVFTQKEKLCMKGMKFLGYPENSTASKDVTPLIKMQNSEDIPICNLIINESIGYGNFGVVSKGTMKLVNGKWIQVAVKGLKPHCDDDNAKNALLNEIKVMQHIGYHINIIKFIGSFTNGPERIFMIVELCNRGTVEDFVKDKRRIRINVDDVEKHPQTTSGYTRLGLATSACGKGEETRNSYLLSLMLKWSYEIAAGMNFLSSKNVVHIDLATRNILLTDDLTAKIADFGLSRKMYLSPTYIKSKNDEPLPFRTMSPEALEHKIFGNESDVWSYGVTIWEMFSFGETPFRNVNDDCQLLQLLKNKHRLEQPAFLKNTPEIYENLIFPCWNINPDQRPTFKDLQILSEEYCNKY